jgi:hypothetical protein
LTDLIITSCEYGAVHKRRLMLGKFEAEQATQTKTFYVKQQTEMGRHSKTLKKSKVFYEQPLGCLNKCSIFIDFCFLVLDFLS